MRTESILVTGGAGFIGSNFIRRFLANNTSHHIYNLDLLTYAGNLSNTKELEKHDNYTFIHGDICDRKLIENIFKKYDIRGVIHFAAESHVDNSISGPGAFIKTNINGTFNLVDTARQYWMDSPFKHKNTYQNCRFHHISTDEVYGSLGNTGAFTESTPYAPNSPYSASKASSDMIVRSYFHTYGLNTLTTNCSNNYGPNQHVEKLIPTIIKKALNNEPIPIYGDGENVRDWLFVDDHCAAIEIVYHNGKAGETYNIGGDEEKTNLEVVHSILNTLEKIKPRKDGSYKQLISFVKDRPGHDKRYAIDASKIKDKLNWAPKYNFHKGINDTIHWYLESFKN